MFQSVRSDSELPRPAYAQGTVAFVADRMRLRVAAERGSYQDATIGNVRTLTGAATLTKADGLVFLDSTGGIFTVTLAPAAQCKGQFLTFKKTNAAANAVTLDANAAELIDGGATTTITAQYRIVQLYCDGTKWHIVNSVTPAVA